jgi:hypothetical protein
MEIAPTAHPALNFIPYNSNTLLSTLDPGEKITTIK